MFSFLVEAMSIRVCDLSVTLVGSLTNCVKLRLVQKLDKARPSEQFPCRLQYWNTLAKIWHFTSPSFLFLVNCLYLDAVRIDQNA